MLNVLLPHLAFQRGPLLQSSLGSWGWISLLVPAMNNFTFEIVCKIEYYIKRKSTTNPCGHPIQTNLDLPLLYLAGALPFNFLMGGNIKS